MRPGFITLFALAFSSVVGSAQPHWSYVVPAMPAPPAADNESWAKTPIDRFLFPEMDNAGLLPGGQAQPARLLRRIYLDLIGLPPSIAETDAFLADPSDEHYARIVDRLLAMPGFGEKWAIGWLDLARYADSDGYQRDGFRNVWPFRDWVIGALNADMPYDRFTTEQLAGDLLPNATKSQVIATGFHRGPILNLEAGTDAEEDRIKQVVDRVNTTGTVWLGTSLACAQCHDHKHDPFSIEEYYSMAAFFNNTQQEGRRIEPNGAGMKYIGPDVDVPLTAEEKARRAEIRVKLMAAEQDFIAKVEEFCRELPEERLAGLKKEAPKALVLIGKDKRTFREATAIKKSLFKKGEEAKILVKLEQKVNRHMKDINKGSFQIGFASRVMKEMDKPRRSFVLKRGDFLTPGREVKPATPSALHPFPEGQPKNRLGLARWIVSPDNPLTARVAVNRIWAELFGRGLVTTLDDFGLQGNKPTHPALLDWLAVTFRDDDAWSMKRIIRRIVLSAAYRQSAVTGRAKRARDPGNAYYARGPSNRLVAELVRDNALAISGLLSGKMLGPPVRPIQPDKVWRVIGEVDNTYYLSDGEDLHRRGIYTLWRRSAHYPSFANFDAPNRGACTVMRQSSNTPLQALTLMNDPAYVEMARAFAARIQQETEDMDATRRLAHAFRIALCRHPGADEIEILRRIYFTSLDTDGSEVEAWFDVATTLLNLHETITK
ncbi:MAG: DUF1549 and DUF1553 domain-containing protein [Verrucomicrobiales bacterium]|nr:DUF1549 and DUF1553 domain-containing protein [Verrucomicrobiales bacterium]